MTKIPVVADVDKGSAPSSPDDYVFVPGKDGLPVRVKEAPPEYPLSLELHPIQNSLLVSVHPPRQPEKQIQHVSCDIVLVIDVSASMSDPAPLPDVQGSAQPEVSGLSILDLTKHAARTILETLNPRDRLAIVTFSQDAKIIQSLTSMTASAKKETVTKIERLRVESATNLWAGIKTGLQIMENSTHIGNVQGIYVLTDGMPNHMCPEQGYVRKLAPMLKQMAKSRPIMPTIHTFGFGYSIMSNLLQSIAEVGNGNYAFIPEAGMIGTVFVHAVANLYTTYATSATLKITVPKNGRVESRSGVITESSDPSEIVLKLGNIQYGQSRDNVVHLTLSEFRSDIKATLTYQLPSGRTQVIDSSVNTYSDTGLPQVKKDYHLHRDKLCHLLSQLFPLASTGEHVGNPPYPDDAAKAVETLFRGLYAINTNPSDPDLQSLMSDLKPSSVGSQDGQISHAVTTTGEKAYWRKWGRHYLPSLLHAHLRQQCNSFKDPGPMRYGVESPLFIECRDALDKAFDDLPAPKPSVRHHGFYNPTGPSPRMLSSINMSRYNFSGNPCFLGSCMVKMVDDGASTNGKRDRELKVQDLRAGMYVLNLLTGEAREIIAVVQTPAQLGAKQQICRIGDGLWITPYHPIFHRPTQQWVFPIDVADEVRDLQDHEAVYSVLLTPAKSASSHAIEIGGISCVTLGHGMVDEEETFPGATDAGDKRIHSFFGDYDAVLSNVTCLPQDSEGIYLCGGVSRDTQTGLVNAFIPDLTASMSSTVVEDESEDEIEVVSKAMSTSKLSFEFPAPDTNLGHCSPVLVSLPSSPSSTHDRIWWQSNSAVGLAA